MRTAIAALIVTLAAGTVHAEAEQAARQDGSLTPAPESEPAPESDSDPGPGPESDSDPDPGPDPDPGADPESHSDPDPETDQVPEFRAPLATAEGACLGAPVPIKRTGVRGSVFVHLADCKGVPFPAAAQALSALALPPKPRADVQDDDDAHDAEPGVDELPRINPELLGRLQRIAERFPGRAIEIVSGYRTRGRAGSRHRSFDALDIRIEGVANEEIVELARTFEDTGVGYYPNSTFVHIDVRESTAYWVDKSGPGQPAKYAAKSEPELAPGTVADAALVEPAAAPDSAEPAAAEATEAEPALADATRAETAPVAEPVAEPAAEPAAVAETAAVAKPAAAAEPTAAAEPAVAAEPAAAERIDAEPAAAERVDAEPAVTEPAVTEPAQAEPAVEAPAPVAPELASIADRALAVMNRALGRPKGHDGSLRERAKP